MRRYDDYDPFAWLYTNYWGEDFHEQALEVLDRLLLHMLPPRAAVLDLCCGDGRVTQMLAKRGYRVTGLDGSEQMLTYARQRNPRIEFLLADARRFKAPHVFDAAVSTFDSLNHIMSARDLERVFRSVIRCLAPGGWFAFDLNREEAYKDLWIRTFSSVDKQSASIARGSWDSSRRIARCDVTLFRSAGKGWQRSDFTLRQKLHSAEEVREGLESAGFLDVKALDATADLGMRGDIGFGRTFWLARKPVS